MSLIVRQASVCGILTFSNELPGSAAIILEVGGSLGIQPAAIMISSLAKEQYQSTRRKISKVCGSIATNSSTLTMWGKFSPFVYA
jgi:hypothetical protein